mgnify:CR=1 FL=1
MPNFHADHINKTDDKCSMGSPIIRICRYELWFERGFAFVLGGAIALILGYFTGR